MLGEGIEQDMVAALKWFIVSARAGNKEASNYANKVGRFLSRDMQREARMMAIDWKKANDEKFPPQK
jgi:TPR repeat protein